MKQINRAAAQITLLAAAILMIGYGAMRGEAATVLSKAIKLCMGVLELDKKKHKISQFLARFRGWIQAVATILTNIHLPNFFKGRDLQRGCKDRLCTGTELLFLSGCIRGVSDRCFSGCNRFFEV